MSVPRNIVPIAWWDAEPARFARDQEEVATRFPDLTWQPDGAGRWVGWLPLWPLDRPQPVGLGRLLGGAGMEVMIAYRQAYPMVPPRIYPIDPQPEAVECTQQRWHVNGDGSLCQFQTDTAWDPRDSICDLIIKAAAWRAEYALVKVGALEQMTLHGIVGDPTLDDLVTATSEHPDRDDCGMSQEPTEPVEITWLRDESLEDLDNLPAPEVIAREIVEDLTAALAEFEAVAAALEAAAQPASAAVDGEAALVEPKLP